MRVPLILLACLTSAAQTRGIDWRASEIPLTARDKREILRLVCPTTQRVRITKGIPDYVCESCPEGSAPMGLDGEYASLDHVVAGHFTAAGAKERLVWFSGCGPNQSPGFSVLLQKDGTHWHKVWLNADDSALAACHVHSRPTGRDLLTTQGCRSAGAEPDAGPQSSQSVRRTLPLIPLTRRFSAGSGPFA